MRRKYYLLIPILLFVIGSIMLFQNNRNPSLQDKDRNSIQTNELKIQQPNRVNQPHLLKVNMIKKGEEIKEHLNNHPHIRSIDHNVKDKSHFVEHEIIVKFQSKQSKEQILEYTKAIDGEIINELKNVFTFRSKKLSTNQLMSYFSTLENVVYAEPHYIYIQNEVFLPNDLLYQERYQWNLSIIEAEAGWDLSRGNKDIKIAIVDTGVDLNHPDLRKRLVKGYNALHPHFAPNDDNGHGTHVAGIIASETNNQEGIAGITWYNKIMPVKVMGRKGYGTSIDIAKGIVWAADHGANVINLSLGNYQPSAVMQEAVQYAFDKNVVLVAAAGNDNTSQPSFPSAFPEVLSVSAVNYDASRAEFSNFGDFIDVTAPGISIPSTYFKNRYAALSGTSMASPHVAGLAGLVLSINPKLSNQQVMDIIKRSAVDIGVPGRDIDFGNGLIDVKNALREAKKTLPNENT